MPPFFQTTANAAQAIDSVSIYLGLNSMWPFKVRYKHRTSLIYSLTRYEQLSLR